MAEEPTPLQPTDTSEKKMYLKYSQDLSFPISKIRTQKTTLSHAINSLLPTVPSLLPHPGFLSPLTQPADGRYSNMDATSSENIALHMGLPSQLSASSTLQLISNLGRKHLFPATVPFNVCLPCGLHSCV